MCDVMRQMAVLAVLMAVGGAAKAECEIVPDPQGPWQWTDCGPLGSGQCWPAGCTDVVVHMFLHDDNSPWFITWPAGVTLDFCVNFEEEEEGDCDYATAWAGTERTGYETWMACGAGGPTDECETTGYVCATIKLKSPDCNGDYMNLGEQNVWTCGCQEEEELGGFGVPGEAEPSW